jgi:hypothetical protein
MDYEDFQRDAQKKSTTWKEYIKNNLLNPFVYGFMFGVGHFVAFLILEQDIFKRLRVHAKIKS